MIILISVFLKVTNKDFPCRHIPTDLAQLKYAVPHAIYLYIDAAPKVARCLICMSRMATEKESVRHSRFVNGLTK
jgi:hypothetical protein